jgi:hypothetical protein
LGNKEKNPIVISCPHCRKDNAINLSKAIKCRHCDKGLTGYKYIKKSIIPVVTAAIIGISAGKVLDDRFENKYFENSRYPIAIEYSIIENCISAADKPLEFNKFKEKKDICECALEGVQKKYSYSEYKEDKNGFLKEYKRQADKVINEKRKR